MTVEPNCTYEHVGTKADVRVEHIGTNQLANLRLQLSPQDKIRAGYAEQYRAEFKPGDDLHFTAVVDADQLALTAEGTNDGQVTSPVTWTRPVQAVQTATAMTTYRFLEPRKLSDADIELRSISEEAAVVPLQHGAYVLKARQKYRLVIRPRHPHVEDVHLLSHHGVAEVESLPVREGAWEFQLQLVSNSTWSTTSVLHYAMVTSDGLQQGELFLLIRPSAGRQWTLAATLGAALTIKGLAGIGLVLTNPEGFWKTLAATLENFSFLLNIAYFISIPLIWIVIWVGNYIWEVLQD